MKSFDIIVVGGGHAGIEAAVVAARMGCRTALVTMEPSAIGRMSCNPAIGGTAKGHLVREIDALGGVMGRIADKTGIQFRMLNTSKGPAVWSPRCQSDRDLYSEEALRIVSTCPGLDIIASTITDAIIEDNTIIGVHTSHNESYGCEALLLASGTFLEAVMHTGLTSVSGGRFGEKSATGLSASLARHGLVTGRLKTGTPPRLKKESINWDILTAQSGDSSPQPFSHFTDTKHFPTLPQVSCYITHTNDQTHSILKKSFDQSPMFTGRIKGIGPRYCPSIEDKINRFSHRDRHQLFLEPEGLSTDMIYMNGFSSSLPAEVQQQAIRTIRGLEDAEILRPGYAVEYDFFPSYQLHYTLQTKCIRGLYTAGQINGTSGYEEAAAQGLMAGINAALKIQKRPPLILGRHEAYIGVLIDDLINKSAEEPYRMFTSHAEHRILLRQDNADRRLAHYAYKLGLMDKEFYESLHHDAEIITECTHALKQRFVPSAKINPVLKQKQLPLTESSENIAKLCRRPQLSLSDILPCLSEDEFPLLNTISEKSDLVRAIEIELKYEGYVDRQNLMIEKITKWGAKAIPKSFDYRPISALSFEAREKLTQIRPESLGQASRIAGVTPADISVLQIYLSQKNTHQV